MKRCARVKAEFKLKCPRMLSGKGITLSWRKLMDSRAARRIKVTKVNSTPSRSGPGRVERLSSSLSHQRGSERLIKTSWNTRRTTRRPHQEEPASFNLKVWSSHQLQARASQAKLIVIDIPSVIRKSRQRLIMLPPSKGVAIICRNYNKSSTTVK